MIPKNSDLLPNMLKISLKASLRIMEIYNRDFTIWKKEDKSPLTEADKRSHETIVTELSQILFPKHGSESKSELAPLPCLSEEGAQIPYSERSKWDLFWLIDPLDGTKEFIKRNGEFTTNIALIQGNKPVLGVVYAPVPDLLYFGSSETGSFKIDGFKEAVNQEGREDNPDVYRYLIRNAQKLTTQKSYSANNIEQDKKIRIIGSRSHRTIEFDNYINKMKQEFKEVEIVTIGSSLKLCYVADNKADIYPRFGPTMEWDTASAHVIVNGAGKKVYRFNSEEEIEYNKEQLTNDWFIVH